MSGCWRLAEPDADTLNNHGQILLERRHYDEALRSLEQALAINPQHVGALNNRGAALRQLGRAEAALRSSIAASRWRRGIPRA